MKKSLHFWKQQKHKKDTGWCFVMLLCICIIMFLVFGVHYTYGILYPNLLKEFNMGEGRTAWVGSLSSGLLFSSSFAAIKCCELTSVTTTSLIGSLCSGLGLILTSIIQDFEWLYIVYGTLFGVGTSFLYTPCLIMIVKWFDKYQAIATGVAAASAALGAVVISPIIEHTIRFNGLRYTLRTAGITYIILSLTCSLVYIPLETRQDEISEKTLIKNDDFIVLKEEKKKRKNDFHLNWRLFKNKSFLMFLVVMMITNFTYYIPMIHLVHYAEHLKISSSKSSLLISIWSVCSICGRLMFGKIASKYRQHLLRIYQVAMFCSGVVTLCTYFAKTYWMLVTYMILYGFLDGSFLGLMSLITLEIVGLKNLAQGYGIMLTSIGLPIALGPPVIGMINDANLLQPQSMFLIAGLPFVIGSLLMTFVIKYNQIKGLKQCCIEIDEKINDIIENSTDEKMKLHNKCCFESSV